MEKLRTAICDFPNHHNSKMFYGGKDFSPFLLGVKVARRGCSIRLASGEHRAGQLRLQIRRRVGTGPAGQPKETPPKAAAERGEVQRRLRLVEAAPLVNVPPVAGIPRAAKADVAAGSVRRPAAASPNLESRD